MSTYQETLNYLYALRNRGSNYGIDRMVRLVEVLGYPEKKYPVIHVAGTNGKGSVCAMLEALYRESGYTTGLFTSPHLIHLGERAQVNRRILTESEIVQFVEALRPAVEQLGREDTELHPTFFEFIAAMAFLLFAAEAVDIALIETGLGGRLDATNVVDPELSIITSISFDHMEMLGDTLAKIASEKAGIIKPGKPVLIGCLPPEAEAVIRETAAERGSKCYSVQERFTEDTLPSTNLSGSFQRWNAAVALYATELLAERFPVQSTEALSRIDWPGRWQKIKLAGRTLILDATHNPEGAEALKQNLEELVCNDGGKPIIVAGTLGDDRGRSLMQAIAPYARELYLVKPNQDRASSTAFLEGCLPEDREFKVYSTLVCEIFAPPAEGVPLEDGQQRDGPSTHLGQPGDTIVVTGSIYLIGEVLERIQGGSNRGGELQDKI